MQNYTREWLEKIIMEFKKKTRKINDYIVKVKKISSKILVKYVAM